VSGSFKEAMVKMIGDKRSFHMNQIAINFLTLALRWEIRLLSCFAGRAPQECSSATLP